ncbi:hypothetical protein J2S22_006181 [Rhodoplanes tepidamans]|uniref:Uncharacterized protein n=1 Tax=Rhodoplanes tepidamans TaxID=200616 RepID=A0ABT5JJQ7_RHOTP|nr:hypothetical protein [Rhodoplanes tepidamans]MDC7789827.1 hypothetical protein [Rhodoplanes tepidamans]MDQ0359225.1 hypothetical protein [Rhodoplanes tepidamans]
MPPAPGWTAAETARFNTAIGNPARCHRKSCRRAGRCLGNPLRCLALRWRGRCDAARLWIRCAVAAREAGRTARAAAEAADRALLAWTKRQAGLPETPAPWRGPHAAPPPVDPASR